MQQQHHYNDYSGVPGTSKKRTNFAKYCIVTFNARTKIITTKDKKYRQLTQLPQLRRKMCLLMILFQKDKNIEIKEFQLL